MANIGREGLKILKTIEKKGKTEISGGAQTNVMTPDQKFNLSIAMIFAFGLVCLLSMITLLANWWQFTNNSFNEYSDVIRQYNDERNDLLEKRIGELEVKISSQSSIRH